MVEYSLARHRKIRRHTVEKSDKNEIKIKYLAGHGSIETALLAVSPLTAKRGSASGMKGEGPKGHGDYLFQLHLLVDTGRARFNSHRPPPRAGQVQAARSRTDENEGGQMHHHQRRETLLWWKVHTTLCRLIDAYTWNKL